MRNRDFNSLFNQARMLMETAEIALVSIESAGPDTNDVGKKLLKDAMYNLRDLSANADRLAKQIERKVSPENFLKG